MKACQVDASEHATAAWRGLEFHMRLDLLMLPVSSFSITTFANHDMNIRSEERSAIIYPKQYFELSKTWDAWNKLSIVDVYNLREEPGFRGTRQRGFVREAIR